MTDLPSMPFYPDAYLADTRGLSLEEKGAYTDLLFYMWRAGGKLQDDDQSVARMLSITPTRWKKVKIKIEKFFQFSDGFFTQKRLTAEHKKLSTKINNLRENGKKGAEVKHQKNNNTGLANAKEMPPDLPSDLPQANGLANAKQTSSIARRNPSPSPEPEDKHRRQSNTPREGDDDDLVKIFDEEFNSVFGYERSSSRHDDAKHADAFRAAGANPDFFRSLCREIMQLLQDGNNDPPTGLVYFANIVPEALAKAERINGNAVHAAQTVVVTLETLGGDTQANRDLLRLFDLLKERLGESVWRSWIIGLRIFDHIGSHLRLKAPTRFIASWVSENYLATIFDCARQVWPDLATLEVDISL